MNNRSIPVSEVDDPELARVFKGMAVYNHGSISVAYRMPVSFMIRIGNTRYSPHRILLEAGSKLVIDVEPLSTGVIDVKDVKGLLDP